MYQIEMYNYWTKSYESYGGAELATESISKKDILKTFRDICESECYYKFRVVFITTKKTTIKP